MKKAILIKTDGTVQEVKPKNSNDFQLDELYELLDCNMVELVKLSDGRIMIADEDGKHEDAIINREATALYQQGRMPSKEFSKIMKEKYGDNFLDMGKGMSSEFQDSICGDVVVCSSDMFL